jgi:hypothetical protein
MTEDDLQRALDVDAARRREQRFHTPEQVLQYELQILQARYANAIRLISNFVGLLPPPDVTAPDGRVFMFNAPDPQDTLRRMRDAVDRMRDEMQVPPAPGYNATELRAGIQHAERMAQSFPVDYNVRNHLRRVLEGTCGKA